MNKLIFTIPVFIFSSVFAFAQGNIQIGSNVQIVMNGDIQMVCKEMNVENNGTVATGSASKVTLISTAIPSGVTIGGTTFTAFNKLDIETADPILLSNDILVNDTLTINSGQLDLNGNTLNFGLNGRIATETSGQSLIGATGGTANFSGDFNAPSEVNPGNLGITISTTENLGNTTIARGHMTQTASGSGYGINRYYDITATNNSALNATIRFSYLDNELNGLNENELELYRSTDGGTTWSREGFDTRNTTDNWVEKSGVDGFSIWTLGSPSQAPLPINLAYFKSECQGGNVLLSWATASETSNERFELEASIDGRDWIQIGTVLGEGNSTEMHYYNFTNSLYVDYSFYRLKQIDFDAKYSYSEISFANCGDEREDQIKVFPNPTADEFSIEIQESKDEVLDLELVNGLGQTIEKRKISLSSGSTKQTFSLKNLPSGFYELVIYSKNGTRTHKILKETK